MTEPILYILMRSDLDSLNPGKGMAQASHATSILHEEIKSLENFKKDHPLVELFNQWKEDRHFGTCIVLDSGTDLDILERVEFIKNLEGDHYADICEDPTYPISDGQHTWLVPAITCGFVFTDKAHSKLFGLDKLDLYP